MSADAGWAGLVDTALQLEVPAAPASVSVVRHVAGGLAAALGFDATALADLRLAVTEVCASFVQARAEPGIGPVLRVSVTVRADALRVSVVDPAALPPGPGTGPPLALLAALTSTFELRSVTSGGTEIVMAFVAAA